MAITIPTGGTGGGGISATRSPSVTFGSYVAKANDIVVFFVNAVSATAQAMTIPSGWVNCHPSGGNTNVASDSNTCALVYHFVTSAEETAVTTVYTATNLWNSSVTGNILGVILRGVDTTTPIDLCTTGFDSANTATPHIMPALTGSSLSNFSTVVGFIAKPGSGASWTQPSGWTSQVSTGVTAGAVEYKMNTLTAAGTTVAAVSVNPSAGDEYVSYTIAFNRAARPKISTFVDDFGSKDTTKWTWDAAASVVSGKANIPTPASSATTVAITSTDTYDLTESSISMEVVQTVWYGVNAPSWALSVRNAFDATDIEQLFFQQDKINCRELVNNVADNIPIWIGRDYLPRFVRLREASGTIYWEYSHDGVTWNVLRSKTQSTSIDMTDVDVRIGASGTATDPVPGTVIIDNINYIPVKAVALQDDFTTLDTTTKWTNSGAAVSGGQLTISPATGEFRNIVSKNYYDLTDSSMSVALVSRTNVDNGTPYSYMRADYISNYYVMMYVINTNLVMSERVNGVDSDTSITYDSTAHKYWRFRVYGGNTYWDTSPDGITWTNRRNKASGMSMTRVQLALGAAGNTGTTPGTAVFDDFNVLQNNTVFDFAVPAKLL